MSASAATPTAPVRTRPVYRRFDPSRVVGFMTVEEWTTFLERSKDKSDYVYGEVVRMSGASPEHNLIAMNAAVTLRVALENAGSDCEVLGSDQKVYVNDRLYYFPDLLVVCGEMQVDFRDALRNPAAIIEVLSPTTEADDRTDKFRDYQQIPSLTHYLLIDQRRVAVTHFTKIAGGLWAIAGDYRALTDTVTLAFSETTLSLPLSQLYRRVTFPDATAAAATTEE